MSSSEESYQRGCSFCNATASVSASATSAAAAATAPSAAPDYPGDSAGESLTNADSVDFATALPSEEYLPQLRRRVMKKSYSCDSECRSVPGMGAGMGTGFPPHFTYFLPFTLSHFCRSAEISGHFILYSKRQSRCN